MAHYRIKYEQGDFGTERRLTVYDADTGQTIGQPRDPFWATRVMPMTEKARRRRFQIVANEILIEAGLIKPTGL